MLYYRLKSIALLGTLLCSVSYIDIQKLHAVMIYDDGGVVHILFAGKKKDGSTDHSKDKGNINNAKDSGNDNCAKELEPSSEVAPKEPESQVVDGSNDLISRSQEFFKNQKDDFSFLLELYRNHLDEYSEIKNLVTKYFLVCSRLGIFKYAEQKELDTVQNFLDPGLIREIAESSKTDFPRVLDQDELLDLENFYASISIFKDIEPTLSIDQVIESRIDSSFRNSVTQIFNRFKRTKFLDRTGGQPTIFTLSSSNGSVTLVRAAAKAGFFSEGDASREPRLVREFQTSKPSEDGKRKVTKAKKAVRLINQNYGHLVEIMSFLDGIVDRSDLLAAFEDGKVSGEFIDLKDRVPVDVPFLQIKKLYSFDEKIVPFLNRSYLFQFVFSITNEKNERVEVNFMISDLFEHSVDKVFVSEQREGGSIKRNFFFSPSAQAKSNHQYSADVLRGLLQLFYDFPMYANPLKNLLKVGLKREERKWVGFILNELEKSDQKLSSLLEELIKMGDFAIESQNPKQVFLRIRHGFNFYKIKIQFSDKTINPKFKKRKQSTLPVNISGSAIDKNDAVLFLPVSFLNQLPRESAQDTDKEVGLFVRFIAGVLESLQKNEPKQVTSEDSSYVAQRKWQNVSDPILHLVSESQPFGFVAPNNALKQIINNFYAFLGDGDIELGRTKLKALITEKNISIKLYRDNNHILDFIIPDAHLRGQYRVLRWIASQRNKINSKSQNAHYPEYYNLKPSYQIDGESAEQENSQSAVFNLFLQNLLQ